MKNAEDPQASYCGKTATYPFELVRLQHKVLKLPNWQNWYRKLAFEREQVVSLYLLKVGTTRR